MRNIYFFLFQTRGGYPSEARDAIRVETLLLPRWRSIWWYVRSVSPAASAADTSSPSVASAPALSYLCPPPSEFLYLCGAEGGEKSRERVKCPGRCCVVKARAATVSSASFFCQMTSGEPPTPRRAHAHIRALACVCVCVGTVGSAWVSSREITNTRVRVLLRLWSFITEWATQSRLTKCFYLYTAWSE